MQGRGGQRRSRSRFQLCRVGGAAPIIGQSLDLQPKGLAAHAPIQREEPALDQQHLVAWREQVDERGFPGAVPGRGISEDRVLGFENALQPGKAFLRDRAKLRAGKIDRGVVHRPQNAVRNVGRAGVHVELPAVRHLAHL
jgi:hypothetical protein